MGSYIPFGHYPINTKGESQPLVWLVLTVKNGKALLITDKLIDAVPYNTTYTDVTWETCTLRKWLNHDFMEAAFTPEERALIITTDLENQGNGKDTQDQIFILSRDELCRRLRTPESRICPPSRYLMTELAAAGTYILNGGCCYWLRTPGGYGPESACLVQASGSLDFDFGYDDSYAVRPALWVRLPS